MLRERSSSSISLEQLLILLRSLVRLDVGESILDVLPGGRDPFDTYANTSDTSLSCLSNIFLSFNCVDFVAGQQGCTPQALPVSFATIPLFCSTFDAAEARLAFDRGLFFLHFLVHILKCNAPSHVSR